MSHNRNMAKWWHDMFDHALTTTFYTLPSHKIHSLIRLLLITDLHNCRYGEKQEELIQQIKMLTPSVVILCGDIADIRHPLENMREVSSYIGSNYESFYVSGNHEIKDCQEETVKKMLRQDGVTVLEGQCKSVGEGPQEINICGVDDPWVGEDMFEEQLDRVSAAVDPRFYTILLSHRPERLSRYAKCGFDLVLSGHAHGGQWRLPKRLNQGLFAPNQGIFPKHTCGIHEVQQTKLIVSRGLARESTIVPRIFNPPELVVVDLTAEEKED